jgi:hypothetical protein
MAEIDINKTGYDLSRQFFNWCFDNPEKINPNHIAMYFFIIEHCNRLGWKEKFGLPTSMVKDAIGIRNFRTYSNTLYDLVDWGFIKMIEVSKNQYSSNIIAIVKNAKAHTKALDKALQKHSQKQSKSIDSIDKQETSNKEQETILSKDNNICQSKFQKYENWVKTNCPNVSKLEIQMTEENFNVLTSKYDSQLITDKLLAMENKKDLVKKYKSVYLTLNAWLKMK